MSRIKILSAMSSISDDHVAGKVAVMNDWSELHKEPHLIAQWSKNTTYAPGYGHLSVYE
jgi:hypothetical protein